MSKDILYAFDHYGVTPDSVKAAEKVLADNGIETDEVQSVLQAIGYALFDCELYPSPECLKQRGILPRDPDEKVVYCGVEMRFSQQKELEPLLQEFWVWFDCNNFATNVEGDYEKETGKSCVWWTNEGDDSHWRDTLPRDEDYHTNGFTDEFAEWMDKKVIEEYLKGKTTLKKIIAAFKKR